MNSATWAVCPSDVAYATRNRGPIFNLQTTSAHIGPGPGQEGGQLVPIEYDQSGSDDSPTLRRSSFYEHRRTTHRTGYRTPGVALAPRQLRVHRAYRQPRVSLRHGTVPAGWFADHR